LKFWMIKSLHFHSTQLMKGTTPDPKEQGPIFQAGSPSDSNVCFRRSSIRLSFSKILSEGFSHVFVLSSTNAIMKSGKKAKLAPINKVASIQRTSSIGSVHMQW
jgi:hypothetical protein